MTLKRELSDADIRHQVEQLAAYAYRGGSVSRWLDSKQFAPRDREAVLLAWARMDEADDGEHKAAS